MDHAKCNIFENVRDTDCSSVVHSLQILEAIQLGRWENKILALRAETNIQKRDEMKIGLPCVTFSGVFKKRKVEGLQEYSQIVVIDVDEIRREQIPAVKDRLRTDGNIAAFFESPTKGLKILFHVDSDKDHHKEYAFPALEKYMLEYHGIVADPSGKDVSRLCFVSSDPDMYYNPEYNVFKVNIEEMKAEREAKRARKSNFNPGNLEPCYDIGVIFKTCVKMVQKSAVGSYGQGNRNNFVYSLSCTLNRAGIAEADAMHLIMSRYISLSPEEAGAAVDSAYRHRKSEFATNLITVRKSGHGSLFD